MHAYCGNALTSPKAAAALLLRIFFGLSLIFLGVGHYVHMGDTISMTTENLGPIMILGQIWAYIFPALQILAGLSFVSGFYPIVAAWAGGISLGVIPAGMVLKTVIGDNVSIEAAMPLAINALVWLIIYWFVIKSFCSACGGYGNHECAPGSSCDCSSGCTCNCEDDDCKCDSGCDCDSKECDCGDDHDHEHEHKHEHEHTKK